MRHIKTFWTFGGFLDKGSDLETMRVSADICHCKESMKAGLKYAGIRIVQHLSSPAPETVVVEVFDNHTHLSGNPPNLP